VFIKVNEHSLLKTHTNVNITSLSRFSLNAITVHNSHFTDYKMKNMDPFGVMIIINYMQINTDSIILIIAENNYIHNIVNTNIIINVVFS